MKAFRIRHGKGKLTGRIVVVLLQRSHAHIKGPVVENLKLIPGKIEKYGESLGQFFWHCQYVSMLK
jgi:hypothetical protein